MDTRQPSGGKTELHDRLVEIRQRQRRHVAVVPDEFFDGINWQDPPPDVPPNALPDDVELYLRESADRVLDAPAKEFLDQRRDGLINRYVTDLLGAIDGTYIDGFSNRVVNELEYQPIPGLIRNIDSPVNRGVGKFLVLALLADHVADDCTDPRAKGLR